MHSLAGSLLVSRPESADPNFGGTLTLLLEHSTEGALGVIINRPTDLLVADTLPEWSDLVDPPGCIFSGGPVETDGLIALGWGHAMPGQLALGLASIDLTEQVPLALATGVERVRIFAGYAGWAGGQLEGEMATGAWWVVPANVDDVYGSDPENLWARVLRRNGGEMAWYAHVPPDPSLN
jgi:putative transcriptional regulator